MGLLFNFTSQTLLSSHLFRSLTTVRVTVSPDGTILSISKMCPLLKTFYCHLLEGQCHTHRFTASEMGRHPWTRCAEYCNLHGTLQQMSWSIPAMNEQLISRGGAKSGHHKLHCFEFLKIFLKTTFRLYKKSKGRTEFLHILYHSLEEL